MKKYVSLVLSVVLLLCIALSTPVVATVINIEDVGSYACEVGSVLVFKAPQTGTYAISSYDNIDPILTIKNDDGTEAVYDNFGSDGEFCAFLFLEDGDWQNADEYCEKVLDVEPECGEAYLGKLMIDLKIRRREKLSEQTEPFDNNPYYQKALRFGDAKLQNELEGYISTIKNRAERERLLAIYNKGEMLLKSAKTQEDFLNASRVFASINGFEDSETKARLCEEKANEIHFSALYSAATMLMKAAKSEEDYAKASDAFSKIKEYKDSEQLAEECANKADNINKTAIYNTVVALMTGNKARNYKKAIIELEKIRGFKDTDQKIEYCNQKIEQINSALSAAGLEKQAKAAERAEAFKEKLPLIKKISLIVVPMLVIAIIAVTILPKVEWGKVNVIDNSSIESDPNDVSSISPQNDNALVESVITNNTTTTPNVIGIKKGEAISQLESFGFIVIVKTAYDDNVEKGYIISQSILSNESVDKGSQITLVESLGKKPLDDKAPTNSSSQINVSSKPNSERETIPVGMELYHAYGYYERSNEIFTYHDFKDGKWVVISGTTTPPSGELVIPQKIQNGTVIGLYNAAFQNCSDVTSVLIPEGVVSIMFAAFDMCTSLKNITIPNSVVSIDITAFSNCISLENVYFKSEAQKEKFKNLFPPSVELVVQ